MLARRAERGSAGGGDGPNGRRVGAPMIAGRSRRARRSLGGAGRDSRVGSAVFGSRVDWVVVVALALDTAIAVIDAVTPVVLINLVVFGPLIAAVRTGPRGTALVSAYAVALAVYEGVPHGIFGTADHVARCAAITVTGALAIWGARLRERGE